MSLRTTIVRIAHSRIALPAVLAAGLSAASPRPAAAQTQSWGQLEDFDR